MSNYKIGKEVGEIQARLKRIEDSLSEKTGDIKEEFSLNDPELPPEDPNDWKNRTTTRAHSISDRNSDDLVSVLLDIQKGAVFSSKAWNMDKEPWGIKKHVCTKVEKCNGIPCCTRAGWADGARYEDQTFS